MFKHVQIFFWRVIFSWIFKTNREGMVSEVEHPWKMQAQDPFKQHSLYFAQRANSIQRRQSCIRTSAKPYWSLKVVTSVLKCTWKLTGSRCNSQNSNIAWVDQNNLGPAYAQSSCHFQNVFYGSPRLISCSKPEVTTKLLWCEQIFLY